MESKSESARTVPMWLAVVVSTAAVVLTIATDRIAVAATTSSLQERTISLEERSKEARDSDAAIMAQLRVIELKVETNAVLVQKIIDKQDEVRHKLGLPQ